MDWLNNHKDLLEILNKGYIREEMITARLDSPPK